MSCTVSIILLNVNMNICHLIMWYDQILSHVFLDHSRCPKLLPVFYGKWQWDCYCIHVSRCGKSSFCFTDTVSKWCVSIVAVSSSSSDISLHLSQLECCETESSPSSELCTAESRVCSNLFLKYVFEHRSEGISWVSWRES